MNAFWSTGSINAPEITAVNDVSQAAASEMLRLEQGVTNEE